MSRFLISLTEAAISRSKYRLPCSRISQLGAIVKYIRNTILQSRQDGFTVLGIKFHMNKCDYNFDYKDFDGFSCPQLYTIEESPLQISPKFQSIDCVKHICLPSFLNFEYKKTRLNIVFNRANYLIYLGLFVKCPFLNFFCLALPILFGKFYVLLF